MTNVEQAVAELVSAGRKCEETRNNFFAGLTYLREAKRRVDVLRDLWSDAVDECEVLTARITEEFNVRKVD